MDRIDPRLLKKYAEGKASEEECEKVEKWLEQEDNLFGQQTECSPDSLPEKPSQANLSQTWKAFVRLTDEGIRQVRYWWWGTRVVLPMLLLIGVGIYLHRNLDYVIPPQTEWMTIETPKGQRAQLRMSDSTMVYLTGRSKLVYPKTFGKNERRISLEYGHAFFEVAKDRSRPFFVQSDATQIKVLGTAFDVTNRIGDKNIAVLLKEGAVEFSDHLGLKRMMTPGDKLVYNKSDAQVQVFEQMDVSTTGQWTTGKLYFRQVHLEDVLGLLEDRYDVAFDLQDEALNTVPVTGRFDGMPLKRILFLLGESTGLTVEQQDKRILIKR